jgi:hypothetical protein
MGIKEKLDSGHVFIQSMKGLFIEVSPEENLTVHFKDCSIQIAPNQLHALLNEKAKEKNSNVSFKII